MSKLGPISHFLSSVMWLVSVTRSQVWMGSRCVKFGVIALTISYWSLEVQHGTSWQRTLWGSEKIIVALHKDGVGYKKIAKTLKLSCSMVVKTIQRFNRTGSTKKLTKKLSARAQWLSVISRGCVWEIDVWVLPALLQRLEGWGVGVSLSVLRPDLAHCIKLVCMAVVPEGSLF